MEELIKQLEVDWGAPGAQWTGQQVQEFIKSWFKALAEAIQSGGSGSDSDKGPQTTDGKTLDDVSKALNKLQEKVTAFLGEAETPSKGQSVSDVANELKKLTDLKAEDFIKFMQGANSVTTVASLPTDKHFIYASIGNAESLSLSKDLAKGEEVHVLIKNTSGSQITVTLPNSGSYACLVDSALNIDGNGIAEVSIISDGTTMYIRAI